DTAADVEGFGDRAGSTDEGDVDCGEPRNAHVDGHLAVVLQPRGDHAPGGLDPNFTLRRQSALANEDDKAARAVAALLDLAAVGVEDAVTEIGAFARQAIIGARVGA